MDSYLVHVWSGHFDFLLLFVDFSWLILKSSSGGLHSSSRSSNATLPAGTEASCSQPGRGSLARGTSCGLHHAAAGEWEWRLCLVLGPWQMSSRAGSAFNTSTERGWQDQCSEMIMGFPALVNLAAEQEERKFYLTHDLLFPLVDMSKKQLIISVPLHYKYQHQRTPRFLTALWNRWASQHIERRLGRIWSDIAKYPILIVEGLSSPSLHHSVPFAGGSAVQSEGFTQVLTMFCGDCHASPRPAISFFLVSFLAQIKIYMSASIRAHCLKVCKSQKQHRNKTAFFTT